MVPEARPLLGPEGLLDPPEAWWAGQWKMRCDVAVNAPQCIAHRGYKAKFPENTMGAFKGAAVVGAHAIETDLHLSRDGVVVLSHDGTLKRCFGIDKKINECDWEYLSTLRTLREPHEPMPRLAELLDFLTGDKVDKMWLLLDIKMDDDAEELMRRTAATIAACPLRDARSWKERIIFGCWTMAYVNKAREFLPSYALAHIGFSLTYAHRFLHVPNVSFNLLQKVLVGPLGSKFLHDARKADRRVFVWTVNDEKWMEWSINAAVDGVITDEPELYLDVCKRYYDEESELYSHDPPRQRTRPFGRGRGTWHGVKSFADILWWNVMVTVFATLFMVTGRYGKAATRPETQKVLNN